MIVVLNGTGFESRTATLKRTSTCWALVAKIAVVPDRLTPVVNLVQVDSAAEVVGAVIAVEEDFV